ncbi:hypothetical protein [Nonomuraea sp. NPDC049480]|uniref:hypothetical protein n=1 Tax=Nonomuraea sp. NPDC049480 TaxID=3364353 RepID=UPI00378729F5
MTTSVLEITVPGPPNSSSPDLTTDATPDGYAYGNLGAVTVTDARAAADASWTVTVTGTDFTTGTAPFEAFETVPVADVYYCSGDATATTGNGTFTPGQTGCAPPPPVTGASLSAARTAFTHTGGTGNNSATWNPLLTVDTGLEDIGGQYTGTVTHTVT